MGERANAIYDELFDMDFMDYDDTRERTIDFIVSLLLSESGKSTATKYSFCASDARAEAEKDWDKGLTN